MSKRFELNANKWYAEIDCDLGANITRLSYGGKYVYNPLNDPNLLKENPFIYGSPILLPANRTADGKFIFEEKEYRLPITEKSSNANLHGSLFKQKFTVKRNKTVRQGTVLCLARYKKDGAIRHRFLFCTVFHRA